MTSSRSNSWLIILVALASWCVLPRVADAGGRKRVVVLELEGPKAEKFHEDLVKLIKKTHTVVPVDKWNGTADELDAASPNEKNIKKVAKKLKIDAIVQGKIEKRRDEYIIQLKLRDGKSGSIVGNRIDVKAEGPRIDGQASGDLKDELIPAIDSVGKGGGGGGDDADSEDEDKPTKKGMSKKDKDAKKKDDADSEDEDKPAKKGFSKKDSKKDEDASEDEDKPAKKGFSKKHDDEETNALRTKKDDEKKDEEDKKPAKKVSKKDDEEDTPLPKPKKASKKDDGDEEGDEDKPKKKKVAKKDDDEEGDGESVEAGSGEALEGSDALTPGERAVDAVLGLSLNARRMAFTYSADLANNPKPYKGVPVAGLLIDATVYPLAIGHKRKDMLKNLGVTVMYDKVLKIQSKQGTATLPTSEARFAFGAVFRYPLGKAVIGGQLRFGRQNFTIGSAGGVTSEMPNVNYTILDPGAFLRYAVTPKLIFNLDLGYMAFLDTGAIQKNDQYGAATVTGFEGAIGGDYLLTKNIFARAEFKFETIGFKFKGTGTQSTMRDADMAQDVFGARDNYLGGAVTVGYLY